MAKVKIQFDNKKAIIRLRATHLFLQGSTALMLEMAQYGVAQIKMRTAAGEDHNNHLFKPYAASTKIFRASTGHPTNKVNLFLTGEMLKSMHGRAVHKKEAKIMFKKNKEAEKASQNQKTRPFFGLNKEDITGLIRIYKNHLARAQQ